MCNRPLTIADSIALERVMRATQNKGRVFRYMADTNTIVEGTARHLVRSADDFTFYDPHADVRDAYLRVTLTTSGFDVVWLVSDLMAATQRGEFAEDADIV